MKITKMHGIGNDYFYFFEEVPANVGELAALLCDRNTAIGSDGLIYICHSDTADYRMRIFNADGSEAKMCGNGIRCVGKYLYDKGITSKTELDIQTESGIRNLILHIGDGSVQSVSVNMGRVVVSDAIDLKINQETIRLMPVDVGNPHAVIFTDEEGLCGPEKTGRLIEYHEMFPDGVNAEYVQMKADNVLRMRVWERGSGVTKACGTGACASAAAAVHAGLCDPKKPVTLILDGGALEFEIDENECFWMKGPAEFAFEGEIFTAGGICL